MSPTTNNRHPGLLTHRGRTVSRRRGSMYKQEEAGNRVVVQEEAEEEEDGYQGLWLYPEVMDLIALVAALCLGVCTSALFAFSYEEMVPADERYVAWHERRHSYWVDKDQTSPVSKGLMIYATLSSAISSFAVVLSVLVRILLTYVTNLKLHSRKRQFLLQWANPMSLLMLVSWVAAVLLTAPTIYFIAWVVFPPEIADHILIRVAIAQHCGCRVYDSSGIWCGLLGHADWEARGRKEKGTTGHHVYQRNRFKTAIR